MIKWKQNKSLKPDVILNKLEIIINDIKKSDKLSSAHFEKVEAEAALFTMVDFGCDLSPFTKKQIFNTAISTVAMKGHLIDKEKVLKELNFELKKYHDNQEKTFFLLTSISLTSPPSEEILKRIENIDGCEIKVFLGDFDKKYSSREEMNQYWGQETEHTPSEYCKIIIETKAKLSHEAVNKSLEVLDLVRAVMCLFSNSSMAISSGGEWNPINTIMLGGMHSLHLSNGELAENFCWCEPAYRKIRASTFSQNLLTNHTSRITWAYEQLTKVPYRRTLKESLIRYVRAFDENDNNTVILKGWGAIEKVVVAGEKNCDLVSKRCSYLFEDREYHKQIIEHLREYRNASVHAGEYLNDVKTHCYQLQYYFLKLISFYLSNAEVFTSIEEANSFLDLPNDISKLHREKELLEKAIKFMEPT
jgi:hypothetical protein